MSILLTENLDLIEDKIKNIIENLPNLQNAESNSRIKKQISQVRSNLLHIERNFNKNKIHSQTNLGKKIEESKKIIKIRIAPWIACIVAKSWSSLTWQR